MKAVILAGGLGTSISEETHLKPKLKQALQKLSRYRGVARRPAPINDLQRGGLESGVFIGSPGSTLGDRPWARLPEGRLLRKAPITPLESRRHLLNIRPVFEKPFYD